LRKVNFRRLSTVIVASFLVSIVIVGCTPKPTPEIVKPDKLVIYGIGDFSGPYATITAPIVAGTNDALEWYNKTKGGVKGVPVEFVYRDTAGKLDLALSAYDDFMEAKPRPFVMMLFGASETEALHDRLIHDKVLTFTTAATVKGIYPPGYSFAMVPAYTDCFGGFIDWVTQHWAKETGQQVKLAILTWENPFGRAIMVPELRDYAKEKGVEIVAEETFALMDLNVTTQLTRIMAKGPNWVVDNTLGHGPGLVINRAAASLGILNQELYDTTPGKIHRFVGPYGSDDSAVRLAVGPCDGMIGIRMVSSWVETDVEGVKLATEWFNAKNREPAEKTLGYLGLWALTYTINHCMEKAVDEVGWEKLDGAAMRDQVIKLKNFSPLGGLMEFTYTADKPEPTKGRLYQVRDGKLYPITDRFTLPNLQPYAYRK